MDKVQRRGHRPFEFGLALGYGQKPTFRAHFKCSAVRKGLRGIQGLIRLTEREFTLFVVVAINGAGAVGELAEKRTLSVAFARNGRAQACVPRRAVLNSRSNSERQVCLKYPLLALGFRSLPLLGSMLLALLSHRLSSQRLANP
jgi:hypothetical protein